MRCHLRTLALLLVPMAALLIAGCGGGAGGVGAGSASEAVPVTNDAFALIADPLEGVPESAAGVPPSHFDARLDRLAEALGLDEEQTDALLAAHAELREDLHALMEEVRSGDLSHAEAREEAESLRESFEAEVQLILTEEQWDALQEMREHRRAPGEGHRNPRDRWDAWLDEIGIDEDQIAAIMEAMETLRTDMGDLHRQIRARDLSWEEAREAAEDIRAAFHAELESILTEEQLEALQGLRPDCR